MNASDAKKVAKAVRAELLADAKENVKVFVREEAGQAGQAGQNNQQLAISDWEMAVSMMGVTLSTYGVVRTVLALVANVPTMVREFAWGRGSPR